MSQADPSRRCAWRVLEAIERDPSIMLDVALRRHGADLDARDAALARELVHGTVRMGLFYDAVMANYLTRPDPPPALGRALRLAAHQILGMDRIPAHAVGASTGSLLRWGGAERLVGVANAIIRRLLADVRPDGEGLSPHQRLPQRLLPRDRALRFGLPSAFVRHLSAAGEDVGDARLEACTRCPPLATRSLAGCQVDPETPGILRQDGPWTWWSDPQAAIAGPVGSGQAVVQDPSQFASLALLGPVTNLRILDVCAAPGGKALALSEGGAWVVAGDRSPGRLRTLASALDGRQDLCRKPRLVIGDGRRLALAAAFDVVLVDAPCSNSGVWGRRPEARHRYTPEALAALAEIQGALLRSAAAAVRPGGRLVYATCSLTPAENHEQVAQLSGWRVVAEETHWPDDFQAGGYVAILQR